MLEKMNHDDFAINEENAGQEIKPMFIKSIVYLFYFSS